MATAVSTLVLLCFAAGLAGVEVPLPAWLRLALALIACLWLPGAVLAGRVRPAEALPLWTAWSLGAISLATLVILEAHLSAAHAGWGIVAVGVFGILTGRLARPLERFPAPADPKLTCVAAALIGGICFMLAFAPGWMNLEPSSEEALHMTTIRKIAGNPALAVDGLLYQKEEVSTYVYPAYHLALAVVARGAHVDPVLVFGLAKPFFFLIAAACLAATVRLLSPGPAVTSFSWLAIAVMMLTNAGGQMANGEDWYYAGQLAPVSHPADFGMSLLLPLGLFCALRYLLAPRTEGRRAELGLAMPCLVVAGATLLIHTRETLQLLILLGCLGLGLLLLRRKDSLLLQRLAFMLGGIVAMGVLFRLRHAQLSENVLTYDRAVKEQVLQELAQRAASSAGWFLPSWGGGDDALLFRPLYVLCLLLAPLLMAFRREFWAVALGSFVAGCSLLLWIPGLSLLLVKGTYSEILMGPVRYFITPALLLTVILAYRLMYLAVVRGERSPWRWGLAAAAGSYLVFMVAAPFLARSTRSAPDAAVALVVGLALFAIGWRASRPQEPPDREPLPALPGSERRRMLGFSIAALLGLAVLNVPPLLWNQIERQARVPTPAVFEEWYPGTPTGRSLPLEALLELRRTVPAGAVVLAPFQHKEMLAVLANVYLVTSGEPWSADLTDFLDECMEIRNQAHLLPPGMSTRHDLDERVRLYRAMMQEGGPVFAPSWTRAQSARFLQGQRVDYLFFPPAEAPHVALWVQEEPDRFETVGGSGGWVLVRVKPATGTRG